MALHPRLVLSITLGLVVAAGCEHGGGPGVGSSASPIIAGRRATEADIGATVALVDSSGYNFCSGTLIAPDVVLTAAHCVRTQNSDGSFGPTESPSAVSVVAGVTDALAAGSGDTYAVRTVIGHPDFPAGAGGTPPLLDEQDVGALVLATPVRGVTPTPILPRAEVDAELTSRRMLGIAGFGTTDPGGMAENTALYVAAIPFIRRSEYEIVAGDPSGPDTCYGDSGGPAYVDTAAGKRVVGITSRGTDPDVEQCVTGTVFTMASAYVDYLEGETGRDLSPAGAPDPGPDPDPAPGPEPDAGMEPDPDPGPDPYPPTSRPDAGSGYDPPDWDEEPGAGTRYTSGLVGGSTCSASAAGGGSTAQLLLAGLVALALSGRARRRRR